jgi:hypothetical protein
MTVTTAISAKAAITKAKDPSVRQSVTIGGDLNLASGTAASQQDLSYYAEAVSIAASGSTNYDLNGSLTDDFGDAVDFAKVTAIIVKASASNTNSVVIGAAASNAFTGPFGSTTHTIAVPPGGTAMLLAPVGGWTVTAGTGDILKVANSSSGSAVVFDIAILGRSA